MLARLLTAVVLVLAVCACDESGPTSPSARGSPRTFYVSPTGSNASDGSATAPWRTLRHAVGQLQAGDTLYLRGGDYTGPENTIDSQRGTVRSGTSTANTITIAGYPSETATIRPSANTSAIGLTTGAPAYLVFQDLIIDMVEGGAGVDGIYLSNGAHHNRFLRLEVRNSGGNGIVFSDNNGNSPFNEVVNCSIHDNGAMTGTNTGYGFYVFTSDNLIEGNDVYSNNGYGLHFYDQEGPMNVARNIIRNNRIHGNGTGGGTNYGIVVAWGDRNLIHDNFIYDNRGGIFVFTDSVNAQVYNNVLQNIAPLEGIIIRAARGTVVRDNQLNGSAIVDLGVDTVLSNNH